MSRRKKLTPRFQRDFVLSNVLKAAAAVIGGLWLIVTSSSIGSLSLGVATVAVGIVVMVNETLTFERDSTIHRKPPTTS